MIKITDMFATPFASVRYPNHEPLCNSLMRLFIERESEGDAYRHRHRRSTQHGALFESKFDLFTWSDEPVRQIARFTHASLSQVIMKTCDYGKEEFTKLRFDYHAWFHITRFGGFQGLHNHQNATWSGIFCVDPGSRAPDRPDSGLVRFHDPRTCAANYMDSGNRRLQMPYLHGGYDIAHTAGQLIIFPSYLYHEVFPYIGESPRVVIAFNCAISGID